MDRHDAAAYGDRAAGLYDDLFGSVEDTHVAVATLAELAGGGPVLELGIGTGRLALPLADRGLEVHGIEASRAMVDRLRAKPGGRDVRVTVADFADVPVDGRYRLVFAACNTFFVLLSQDAQVACFERVAAHLTGDGVFAVEAFVPDMARWTEGRDAATRREEHHRVLLETSRHDPAAQRIDSFGIVVADDGVRMVPVHLRYSWPSELDLMARLAGLRLRARWGGWDRGPFDSSSLQHVSVYGQP